MNQYPGSRDGTDPDSRGKKSSTAHRFGGGLHGLPNDVALDPDYPQWRRENLHAEDSDFVEWQKNRFRAAVDSVEEWREEDHGAGSAAMARDAAAQLTQAGMAGGGGDSSVGSESGMGDGSSSTGTSDEDKESEGSNLTGSEQSTSAVEPSDTAKKPAVKPT
ncbi:hypothetical protein BH09PSE5_BH09PSE5_19220 [soil metagenome]